MARGPSHICRALFFFHFRTATHAQTRMHSSVHTRSYQLSRRFAMCACACSLDAWLLPNIFPTGCLATHSTCSLRTQQQTGTCSPPLSLYAANTVALVAVCAACPIILWCVFPPPVVCVCGVPSPARVPAAHTHQLMYSDLDERNITELSKFDASVALETLEHYCSGDLSQVRNRRAYLAGAVHGSAIGC